MEMNAYEEKHLRQLAPHLAECTVLLKKDGSFPLDKPSTIAAYGNGVRRTVKGGTGSGEVNSRFFVNIEEGLKQCGFTLISTKWLDEYDRVYVQARAQFKKAILQEAKKKHVPAAVAGMGAIMPEPDYQLEFDYNADCAIYVVSRISGEGSDRQYIKGDILLTETEVRDINLLNEHYEKFMLVLNTGGPVDLSPVNHVKNILVLSQLGVETGIALGRILLGESPSGKLTTTWATQETYPKLGEFGDLHDTRYKEGIFVGYRYFDAFNVTPLYPFGFGLGYSEFEIKAGDVFLDGQTVTVQAEVKNAGKFDGKEVVQVYVFKPENRQNQAKKELAAFRKTRLLHSGETEMLSLSFKLSDLASFDVENHRYYLEKGSYRIYLGNSSRDNTLIRMVTVNEEVVIRNVKNLINKPDFQDPDIKTFVSDTDSSTVFSIDADTSSVITETVDYNTLDPVSDFVKNLSDDELVTMNIGAFNSKGGMTSIIGNASFTVAGAAGETSSALKSKGIGILVMADGPAGLRLAKNASEDEKGIHSLDSSIPATILEFMSPFQQKLMKWILPKPKKNARIFQQFTTAIPIGTAIGQSWNEAFARLCGDIVGSEMELFHVNLWLAPAMNIHRDIRCGRNFEYYSEDPLLSGKMAAGITRGVQQHKGCGVTIKHYACNNQETNRANSNSILSERALREIYLRGFAICIKEAAPHALMTSYNLINGEHLNQTKALVSDFLYKELQYTGIVMTDWLINHGTMDKRSRYPGAYADKVAAAGNCLFMPGSKGDFNDLKKGFDKGTISRNQLEINISRLCRKIYELYDM
ncbi:MAG: glycoside hydrolase family 3 C-terminal domain-containing protein [Flexilinea sp.]|nr:glycoside hydrolase family 3 C-terminal domain-containing protein [Flexilinea sp.]